jgi:hypothetical protein
MKSRWCGERAPAVRSRPAKDAAFQIANYPWTFANWKAEVPSPKGRGDEIAKVLLSHVSYFDTGRTVVGPYLPDSCYDKGYSTKTRLFRQI